MSGLSVQRYRRSWLTWTWVGAFGGIPVAVGAYGAVNDWPVGVWAVCAVVGLALGIRSAMVAVTATPDRLIVRNFFTTRRIPWNQVRTIERPRPWVDAGRNSGFANRNNGLHIRLTDGRTRIAGAFTPAGWDPPNFADAVIQDLRRYARQAAAGSSR